MKLSILLSLIIGSIALAAPSLYVDAAPNAYGSPDYAGWQANAYAQASAGTFVNMASSINAANVGTTNFEIQDEVVYSFGDLGKRLTFVYWIPDETVASLTGRFQIGMVNNWGGDVYDFYLGYYGSSWLTPTKWVDYNGGVLGVAGVAWWGAYGVNTQEALDADIAAWGSVDEQWIFTAKLDGIDYSLTAYREGNVVPAPAAIVLASLGLGMVRWLKGRKSI